MLYLNFGDLLIGWVVHCACYCMFMHGFLSCTGDGTIMLMTWSVLQCSVHHLGRIYGKISRSVQSPFLRYVLTQQIEHPDMDESTMSVDTPPTPPTPPGLSFQRLAMHG